MRVLGWMMIATPAAVVLGYMFWEGPLAEVILTLFGIALFVGLIGGGLFLVNQP